MWAAIMLLAATHVGAQTIDGCNDATLDHPAVANCLNAALAQVEATLVETIQAAEEVARELDDVTRLDEALPDFAAANEAFLAYREAACRSVGTLEGSDAGSGQAIAQCHIDLTQHRIALIRQSAGLVEAKQ